MAMKYLRITTTESVCRTQQQCVAIFAQRFKTVKFVAPLPVHRDVHAG